MFRCKCQTNVTHQMQQEMQSLFLEKIALHPRRLLTTVFFFSFFEHTVATFVWTLLQLFVLQHLGVNERTPHQSGICPSLQLHSDTFQMKPGSRSTADVHHPTSTSATIHYSCPVAPAAVFLGLCNKAFRFHLAALQRASVCAHTHSPRHARSHSSPAM